MPRLRKLMPRPVVILMLTFAFPSLVTTAWWYGWATLGETFIASQIALLSFQIQKHCWSEDDFFTVRSFFIRK